MKQPFSCPILVVLVRLCETHTVHSICRALGLGQTRGRLYIKHPDVFKVRLADGRVLMIEVLECL